MRDPIDEEITVEGRRQTGGRLGWRLSLSVPAALPIESPGSVRQLGAESAT
jgi:hypothetical protein